MEIRDPKKDPLAGDVLTKGTRTRRVTMVEQNIITYELTTGGGKPRNLQCWISTWRDWARKAEVVTVGGGA